jgi:hypothetical protein
VKLVEAGCSWPHGKTARGVAGGDVVKWICNITTNKVGGGCGCLVLLLQLAVQTGKEQRERAVRADPTAAGVFDLRLTAAAAAAAAPFHCCSLRTLSGA